MRWRNFFRCFLSFCFCFFNWWAFAFWGHYRYVAPTGQFFFNHFFLPMLCSYGALTYYACWFLCVIRCVFDVCWYRRVFRYLTEVLPLQGNLCFLAIFFYRCYAPNGALAYYSLLILCVIRLRIRCMSVPKNFDPSPMCCPYGAISVFGDVFYRYDAPNGALAYRAGEFSCVELDCMLVYVGTENFLNTSSTCCLFGTILGFYYFSTYILPLARH